MSDFSHGTPTSLPGISAELQAYIDGMNSQFLMRSPWGESIFARLPSANGVALANQTLFLGGFTAKRSEVITQLRVFCGGTAAGASPTLVRLGVYKREQNGDLTLVASTPNDITLLAASNTTYTKALSAPFSKVVGVEYMAGLLIVSAAAFPTMMCQQNSTVGGYQTEGLMSQPMQSVRVTGLADLPASILFANLVTTTTVPAHMHLLQ